MRTRSTQNGIAVRFGALLVVVLGGLAGCSQTSPVQPAPAPSPRLEAASPANVLRVPMPSAPAASASVVRLSAASTGIPTPGDWIIIGSGIVGPAQSRIIEAGRYRLLIDVGCVDTTTEFTIATYDTSVLDVELGPHGRSFGRPVMLTVSYAGTQADPASPSFDGSIPEIAWYNEANGMWLKLPGQIDEQQLTITAMLTHFSRYAVGGKAGW